MIQARPKPMSFEEFVAWLPQDGRYELIDGNVFEMQPTGQYEEVGDFLDTQLTLEVHRLQLPYKFPKRALIKAAGWGVGYLPDVVVVDRHLLKNEPHWEREATIVNGSTVKLVVEVVSTNWETDYARKYEDYEAMGIAEYWIADYGGLGGKKYIGSPKQPTFSVCTLVGGEYQMQQFRGQERIISAMFPELNLTAAQILAAGEL
ncbi:MAG: Uma2 family endonuclease [Cyanobacteriota bacterium]|nr:Uma2 family endonuclease [Cyanobacteriota bacterium]